MRTVNKVFLMGNLGADVELRYSQDGKPRALFNVATHRLRKKDDGEWEEETEWHRVVTFGTRAENCAAHLRKGSGVLVEGRATSRSWEDPNHGRRWIHEVFAYEVVFLPGPRVDGDSQRSARSGPPPSAGESDPPAAGEEADIPF